MSVPYDHANPAHRIIVESLGQRPPRRRQPHTPGPWFASNIGLGPHGRGPYTFPLGTSPDEAAANARLIAAAPEMLAMLVDWPVNMSADEWNAWHDKRRALLARITTP